MRFGVPSARELARELKTRVLATPWKNSNVWRLPVRVGLNPEGAADRTARNGVLITPSNAPLLCKMKPPTIRKHGSLVSLSFFFPQNTTSLRTEKPVKNGLSPSSTTVQRKIASASSTDGTSSTAAGNSRRLAGSMNRGRRPETPRKWRQVLQPIPRRSLYLFFFDQQQVRT